MRGARLLQLGVTITILTAFVACRPARGPQGEPTAGIIADLARTYQGQPRLLAGLAEKTKISHKRGDALEGGKCDVAVLITSAVLAGDTARFTLQPIGLPQIETQAKAHRCAKPPREYTVVISGLDARGSMAGLSEEIDRVLQTPEIFLTGHGVPFSLKAATTRGPVADKQVKATYEERTLARAVTTPYKRLLSVAPIRRSDRPRTHYAGEIAFEALVGTDGRLYDVRLPGSFEQYAEGILKALALWRYQPARRGDQPVAYRIGEERTVFSVL